MGENVPKPFLWEHLPGTDRNTLDGFCPERIAHYAVLPFRELNRIANQTGYSWIQFKRDYCNWDYAARRPKTPLPSGAFSVNTGWERKYYDVDREVNPNRNYQEYMKRRYVMPFFHNTLTDAFNIITVNVTNNCFDREKTAFECLEYYGMKQGEKLCGDYYDDFMECRVKKLQQMRWDAIKAKRKLRYYDWQEGKRPQEEVYMEGPNPLVNHKPYHKVEDTPM